MADPSQMSASQFRPASEDSDIEDLRARLAEVEDTIRALRLGEADALVVNGPEGPQVDTLQGADHPYRVLVEQMHEGTLTIAPDGLVLYSNGRFAAMIGATVDSVAGMRFGEFLTGMDSTVFSGLVEAVAASGYSAGDLNLHAPDGSRIPVRVSVAALGSAGMQNFCLVISDLREQHRNEALVKEEQLSRLILEQAGEAIVVIDPAGIIVRRSESAFRLAGLPVLMGPFDRVFPLIVHGLPLETGRIPRATRPASISRGWKRPCFIPTGLPPRC